jgi:c-di-GMP-binding flagellar brake protein YcgR
MVSTWSTSERFPEPVREASIERRRHHRTHVSMSVNCVRLEPEGGDVVDRLHIVDISRGGLGAVADRAYYPGQRLVLCLPRTNDAGQRHIYATIVRCRQHTDGYRLGLEFDNAAISGTLGNVAAAAA